LAFFHFSGFGLFETACGQIWPFKFFGPGNPANLIIGWVVFVSRFPQSSCSHSLVFNTFPLENHNFLGPALTFEFCILVLASFLDLGELMHLRSAWIFDGKHWTETDEMSVARANPACSLVEMDDEEVRSFNSLKYEYRNNFWRYGSFQIETCPCRC